MFSELHEFTWTVSYYQTLVLPVLRRKVNLCPRLILKKKNWRTLVVNINGLRDKKAAVQSACDYLQPDAIIGCETKITNNIFTSEILPPHNTLQTHTARTERHTEGGGEVLMAIRDGYVVNKVDIVSLTDKYSSCTFLTFVSSKYRFICFVSILLNHVHICPTLNSLPYTSRCLGAKGSYLTLVRGADRILLLRGCDLSSSTIHRIHICIYLYTYRIYLAQEKYRYIYLIMFQHIFTPT